MSPADPLSTAAFTIHSAAEARAALAAAAEAGVAVTLVSAAGAGAYVGPAWFREVVEAARREHPDALAAALLDCGARAGDVLAAFRAGVPGVIFTGGGEVADKLAALARAHGAAFHTTRPPAHDLLDRSDPLAVCRQWLMER
jgi:DNA-binding NarL/FixJ family response regulator